MNPPACSTDGGVLYLDKPLGWSSFDVVKRVRGLLGAKKVGHAGTLDPLATGLLIICLGKTCKRVSSFQQLPKTYEGLFRLGESRPSYDLETKISEQHAVKHVATATLHAAVATCRGHIMQKPPVFSALRINGKRAYSYARQGLPITLQPREVTVHALQLLRVHMPWVRFRLCCSKGTYVRSLVHAIGQQIGVGATLQALRRTAIGDIDLLQAQTIEELTVKPNVLQV